MSCPPIDVLLVSYVAFLVVIYFQERLKITKVVTIEYYIYLVEITTS